MGRPSKRSSTSWHLPVAKTDRLLGALGTGCGVRQRRHPVVREADAISNLPAVAGLKLMELVDSLVSRIEEIIYA
jgi:hypothetical protein